MTVNENAAPKFPVGVNAFDLDYISCCLRHMRKENSRLLLLLKRISYFSHAVNECQSFEI